MHPSARSMWEWQGQAMASQRHGPGQIKCNMAIINQQDLPFTRCTQSIRWSRHRSSTHR